MPSVLMQGAIALLHLNIIFLPVLDAGVQTLLGW